MSIMASVTATSCCRQYSSNREQYAASFGARLQPVPPRKEGGEEEREGEGKESSLLFNHKGGDTKAPAAAVVVCAQRIHPT